MNSELGQLIQQKREEAGLSQYDVAQRLGFSTAQFVSNFERGISRPPARCLKALARMIRIDSKQLTVMYKRSCMEEFERRLDRKLRA